MFNKLILSPTKKLCGFSVTIVVIPVFVSLEIGANAAIIPATLPHMISIFPGLSDRMLVRRTGTIGENNPPPNPWTIRPIIKVSSEAAMVNITPPAMKSKIPTM